MARDLLRPTDRLVNRLLLPGLFSLGLALGGCGNDGGVTSVAGSGVAVSGAAQKGPYLLGAVVTAWQLDPANGARTATSVATSTDANGNYSLPAVPWSGLTEIHIAGGYFDEAANANSTGSLGLSALVDLQDGATVRVNLLTHLLAGRLRTLMTGGQTHAAARTQALADLAARFNLNFTGSIGPENLDLTDGAGANAQDNANLLLLSTAFLAGGIDTQTKIDALRDDFADNGRFDTVSLLAMKTAARGLDLDTLRTRLQTRYASILDAPAGADLPNKPAWTHGVLTDTGITANQCYQAGSSTLVSCASAEALALNPAQDGMTGRDADPATNSDADGKLGFSYSKLGSNGQPLTLQSGTYSEAGSEAAGTKWSCVQDKLTGLIWEVKTDDGGLRDKDNRYTNFHSTYYGSQAQMDAASNTYGYVAAVNVAGLCGATDWRLPTAEELQGLVDYGVAWPGPTLDANFFPNTPGTRFWSSSPYAGDSDFAWFVYFGYGFVSYDYRGSGYAVRLVRASQ